MSVETSSLFSRVIEDHLALKERNARLGESMPIDRYKDEDVFDNHPLFKSEEEARLEETMDGVEPDFSDASLEDVGVWPGEQQGGQQGGQQAVPVMVEEPTAEDVAPVAEESGFWGNGNAREFDWGD
ncbi:MAG: hypothetical protein ACRDLM_09495 [Gaiellaceae bacterium]